MRKAAKPYGTARLAEGADVGGRRVLVVEDVVTSGGQIVISARQLREMGAEISHALCVIDRQEGGADALAADKILLRALLTREDLDQAEGPEEPESQYADARHSLRPADRDAGAVID